VVSSTDGDSTTVPDSRKEACKTYSEQTKMLVTLASGFLLGPAGSVAFLKDRNTAGLVGHNVWIFISSETMFILSVLLGYVVMGAIAGSQDKNEFNVFIK
jgi:hypothetical protein